MVILLADAIVDAGHTVGSCRYCGRVLATNLDHAGKPHGGPPRRYCSRTCRAIASGKRRGPLEQLARAHRRENAGLIHMHALEAAGQTAIGDPLPPVPALAGASR